jgi:hypothetical protein
MIAVAHSQLEDGLRAGGPQGLVRKLRRYRVDPQRESAPSFIAIRYGGRRFVSSREMGEIFLRHAREVIESGESELVPLRHIEGVELLLISRLTPYSLADLDVPELLVDDS